MLKSTMQNFLIIAVTLVLHQYAVIGDLMGNLSSIPPPYHQIGPSPPPYIQPGELPPAYSTNETNTPPTTPASPLTPLPTLTPVSSSTSPSSPTPESPLTPVSSTTPVSPSTSTPSLAPEQLEDSLVFDPIHNLLEFDYLTNDFAPQLDNILAILQQIAQVPQAYFGDALVNYVIDTKDEVFKHIERQQETVEQAIDESTMSPQLKAGITEEYGQIVKDALTKIDKMIVKDTKASLDLFEAINIPKMAYRFAQTVNAVKKQQRAIATHLAQIPTFVKESIIQYTEPIRQATREVENKLKQHL